MLPDTKRAGRSHAQRNTHSHGGNPGLIHKARQEYKNLQFGMLLSGQSRCSFTEKDSGTLCSA